MHLLHLIITKTGNEGKELLAEFFLQPNYKSFEFDYEFNELGEIVKQTPRHRTERSKDDIDRYKRIAIDAVIDYVEKENRNLKSTISSKNITNINTIIKMIQNKEPKHKIKSSIVNTMKSIQQDIISSLQVQEPTR